MHAIAHITGGGLPGNVPRVLGDDLDAVFERDRWPVPPIFAEIQRAGGVDDDEMARVFNLGLGMVVAVPPGGGRRGAGGAGRSRAGGPGRRGAGARADARCSFG